MPCFVEMINRRKSFPLIFVNELAEAALINAVDGHESIAAFPSDCCASLRSPVWLMPKDEASLGALENRLLCYEAVDCSVSRLAENVGTPSRGSALTSAVGAVGVLVASSSPSL